MRLPRRPGQALAEFALVIPVFLALMMGLVDLGWLYHHQLMLADAAREGARLGATGQPAAAVRAGIEQYLTDAGFTPVPTDSQIGVTFANAAVQVTITVTEPTLFGLSGPSLQLSSSTQMRTE